MASFNKVILMGRLTRDPELRYTQSNMAICKVGLAVNRRFKDSASGEWREDTTFVDVTVFGKRAEAFEKYHKKGSDAFFEGRLAFDTWDDKNTGQKRSKLYVIADNWEFVGAGRGEERGAFAGGTSGADSPYDETPPRRGASAAAGGFEDAGGRYGDYGSAGATEFVEADDTPF